jgi:hypothetical protein
VRARGYRNFQYRPQEAENKYYLTRWAELYFSRNRFTIERDQMNSLYFLMAMSNELLSNRSGGTISSRRTSKTARFRMSMSR